MNEFDFNKQCLFCVDACKPIDPKRHHRWGKVARRECFDVIDAPPF